MKISRKIRQPRENEIKLLELLASGPCALDSGLVGRCSSRGWIRYIALDEFKRGIYALTLSGHAQLDEHRGSMPIPAGGQDRSASRADVALESLELVLRAASNGERSFTDSDVQSKMNRLRQESDLG
jgi:hypothetical protein